MNKGQACCSSSAQQLKVEEPHIGGPGQHHPIYFEIIGRNLKWGSRGIHHEDTSLPKLYLGQLTVQTPHKNQTFSSSSTTMRFLSLQRGSDKCRDLGGFPNHHERTTQLVLFSLLLPQPFTLATAQLPVQLNRYSPHVVVLSHGSTLPPFFGRRRGGGSSLFLPCLLPNSNYRGDSGNRTSRRDADK